MSPFPRLGPTFPGVARNPLNDNSFLSPRKTGIPTGSFGGVGTKRSGCPCGTGEVYERRSGQGRVRRRELQDTRFRGEETESSVRTRRTVDFPKDGNGVPPVSTHYRVSPVTSRTRNGPNGGRTGDRGLKEGSNFFLQYTCLQSLSGWSGPRDTVFTLSSVE